MRLSTKSLAAVAALTLGAVAAPMAASAQSYGYSQNYGTGAYAPSYAYDNGYRQQQYDPCARERQGRTGAGAVIGGGAGAVIGSQLAARGRRTEGSILGGVLGAVIGSQVGRSSSDACRSYQSSYGQNGYYAQNGYSQSGQAYYDDRYSRDQAYRYDDYDRRSDHAQDRDYYDDRSRPVETYQNSDGCRLAESQIRLPDGRTDTRYVRTCPDQYGRYRVVD